MKKKNHLGPFCRARGSHLSPQDGSGCRGVAQIPPSGPRETNPSQGEVAADGAQLNLYLEPAFG